MSTSFTEHSKNYNKIQTAYFENSKKRFQRQLEISGVIKNDDEINEMIHSGNVQVYTQDVIKQNKTKNRDKKIYKKKHLF